MHGTSDVAAAALVGGVRRIAVLRANALGDYLLAVPALESLRRAYPDARLTLLGTPWHAEFLTGRPGPVDDVVALPPISGVSTVEPGHAAPGELCDELRGRGFDLAVQIHGGGRFSNPFVRGLGARVSAGMCAPGAPRLDRWVPYTHYHHETLRFLQVAALVGGVALGIGALAALYERCDLVIANDTGPRHLAAAVGTPTVAVYWCGNLINAGPLSRTAHRPLISWTTACPRCGASGVAPDAERCPHDVSWVGDVSVDMVAEQAEELLAGPTGE
ncbi:glycosyltransferase family 9 protein [Nonomuraea sp. NPDC050643]|uniref:glycosyltransferase family 9 protein n=1 Tax=Nonomuraea sp. NPDC050643 TaxID=3155660 RepID=UPI0033E9D012